MILEIAHYPPWKERVVRAVTRVLFIKRVHVIIVHGIDNPIKVICSPCNGTGRVMQVDTYNVVDCPRCYGRGRSTCPV